MSLNLDAAANVLYRMEPIRGPIVESMIASLNLPEGSTGLDAGCGIGLQALRLAQAVGPGGHITGMDVSASFVDSARILAEEAGFTRRVSFQEGSWDRIPSNDGAYDWVWSMDAAGYAPDETITAIQELKRVIRPGGRLIIGFWSSQSILPGYPALEARLNATPPGIAPFTEDARPEAHFLFTLSKMRRAGLVNPRAATFTQTISAPLTSGIQDALTGLFAMRWDGAEMHIDPADWQAYLRLCRAESPEWILNNPGYYAFFTYSVFSADVPGR